MDPQACLDAARDALADGDYETASDRCEEYRHWRMMRGWEPRHGDKRLARYTHACLLKGFPTGWVL